MGRLQRQRTTEIIAAGFDLLTYYKGTWTRSPQDAFTTTDFTTPDGATVRYELAERSIDLPVPARGATPAQAGIPASTLTLRLIVRRSATGHQTPILTNRTDLTAPEVAYRMANRWRQENYFTCPREHFALDALTATPTKATTSTSSCPTLRKPTPAPRSAPQTATSPPRSPPRPSPPANPATVAHRRHAIIENVHADLKASALAHLPSGVFNANAAWLVCAVMAFNLTRAAATLTGASALAKAATATIRRRLITVPARIATSARRRHLHLPQAWPWKTGSSQSTV